MLSNNSIPAFPPAQTLGNINFTHFIIIIYHIECDILIANGLMKGKGAADQCMHMCRVGVGRWKAYNAQLAECYC